MILTCPSCATRFSVPEEAIGVLGRAVRCGACRHQWFEGPAAAADADAAASPPPERGSGDGEPKTDFDKLFETEPLADDAAVRVAGDSTDDSPPVLEPAHHAPALSAAPAIRSSQRAGHWSGFTALASVMIAGLAALALLADVVIEVWPPSKRLYAMVGLPFAGPGEGLEIRNITARIEAGADGARLVIEGDIVNVSRDVKPAPMVQVVLRDAADKDVASWRFPASETNMIPSETVSFRTAYDRPPAGAAGAALGFSSAPAATIAVPRPERAAARD